MTATSLIAPLVAVIFGSQGNVCGSEPFPCSSFQAASDSFGCGAKESKGRSRNPANELIHGVRFYPIRKRPVTKFIEVGDRRIMANLIKGSFNKLRNEARLLQSNHSHPRRYSQPRIASTFDRPVASGPVKKRSVSTGGCTSFVPIGQSSSERIEFV
jgi:hypothetical protein